MIRNIFLIAALVLTITSCEIEMSNNGDLDGLWQMTEMKIDDNPVKDMRNTGTVIGVQFRLMNIRNSVGGNDLYCRFVHEGNTLRIYDFRIRIHDVSDLPVEDVSMLSEYGIFSLDETFKIETLSESYMVLRSSRSLLKFRKY